MHDWCIGALHALCMVRACFALAVLVCREVVTRIKGLRDGCVDGGELVRRAASRWRKQSPKVAEEACTTAIGYFSISGLLVIVVEHCWRKRSGHWQRRRDARVAANLGLFHKKHPTTGWIYAFRVLLLQPPHQAFFSNVVTAFFDLDDEVRAIERLDIAAVLRYFSPIFEELTQ
jgi:hypothetical protein